MRPHGPAAAVVTALLTAACTSTPVGSGPPAEAPGSPSSSSGSMPSSASPSAAPSASPSPTPLAWHPIDAGGPAAREDHTWTLGGDGRVAYLFGGRDGATLYGDTWAYELASDTWTQLDPADPPPARFGHEAVWVDDVGLVIFAGQAGSRFFGDLWAYDADANAWAQLPAGGDAPTPRYGSCASLGPDGRLWVSHGFTEDQVRFADTRAYDFGAGSWTDESPADGARPVERCLHGCWWTDDGTLELYGGQTTGQTALDDRWVFGDDGWSRVEGGAAPPGRNLYARGRLPGATLILGGQALDGTYLSDLWVLADGNPDATALAPIGAGPPARAGAELIIDAERGRALLFGGRDANGAFGDVWSLEGL